jgi:class 3 adenylate cyclase
MNMRETLLAALRRDPDLLPKVAHKLRGKIDEEKGPMSTVVQAAEALEPILEEAARKRPSRLSKLGFKSAHVLASLAVEDKKSNDRLAAIADGATVGILFVDIADFMKYTADHGDEAASKLISELDALINKAIKPVKGECVKNLGDGFLLAFPSASQAVRGAVQMREAIAKKHLPVKVRMAVHAGEPLVEHGDLLGLDVNLTARLLDFCEPGEIVVSEAARDLAGKRLRKISFGDPRDEHVKGLVGKVKLFSVNPDVAQPGVAPAKSA